MEYQNTVEKKQKGQFFTESRVANKIVHEICSDLLKKIKTNNSQANNSIFLDEILRLKIVDPAMGDGVFLVTILRFFLSSIKDIWRDIIETNDDYSRNIFKERFQVKGSSRKLSKSDQDGILLILIAKMIYGVEVDKLVYNKALKNILGLFKTSKLRKIAKKLILLNLKQGNSLISNIPLKMSKYPLILTSFKVEIDLIARIRENISAKLMTDGATAQTEAEFAEISKIRNYIISKLREEIDNAELTYLGSMEKFNQKPFFWEIEFPEVFIIPKFGFDITIGNPPWDKWKLYDREWLGSTVISLPELTKETIMNASADVKSKYQELKQYYKQTSWYFDKCYKWQPGEKNLYKLFLERFIDLCSLSGYIGIIIPSGFLGEYYSEPLRRVLLEELNLLSITEIVSSKELFPEVEPGISISVIIAQKDNPQDSFLFCKDISSIDDFQNSQMRLKTKNLSNCIEMSRDDIVSSSPLYIIPSIRNEAELLVTRKITKFPTLTSGSWACKTSRGLDMTNDRNLLTKEDNSHPLIEGRHLVRLGYDNRHPRYWIKDPQLYSHKFPFWGKKFIGWKNFSGNHRRRRMRIAIFPRGTFISNSILCLYNLPDQENVEYYLAGVMCSIPFEFRIREICYGLNINQYIVDNMNIPVYNANNILHKALVELVKEFLPRGMKWAYRKMESTSTVSKSALETEYYENITQIDAIVALVYNLTESEFLTTLKAHPKLESFYLTHAIECYKQFKEKYSSLT